MQKNAANPHGCSRKVKCGFFGQKNNLNEGSITKIFALTFQRIYLINRKTELKELLERKLEFKAFYVCENLTHKSSKCTQSEKQMLKLHKTTLSDNGSIQWISFITPANKVPWINAQIYKY